MFDHDWIVFGVWYAIAAISLRPQRFGDLSGYPQSLFQDIKWSFAGKWSNPCLILVI